MTCRRASGGSQSGLTDLPDCIIVLICKYLDVLTVLNIQCLCVTCFRAVGVNRFTFDTSIPFAVEKDSTANNVSSRTDKQLNTEKPCGRIHRGKMDERSKHNHEELDGSKSLKHLVIDRRWAFIPRRQRSRLLKYLTSLETIRVEHSYFLCQDDVNLIHSDDSMRLLPDSTIGQSSNDDLIINGSPPWSRSPSCSVTNCLVNNDFDISTPSSTNAYSLVDGGRSADCVGFSASHATQVSSQALSPSIIGEVKTPNSNATREIEEAEVSKTRSTDENEAILMLDDDRTHRLKKAILLDNDVAPQRMTNIIENCRSQDNPSESSYRIPQNHTNSSLSCNRYESDAPSSVNGYWYCDEPTCDATCSCIVDYRENAFASTPANSMALDINQQPDQESQPHAQQLHDQLANATPRPTAANNLLVDEQQQSRTTEEFALSQRGDPMSSIYESKSNAIEKRHAFKLFCDAIEICIRSASTITSLDIDGVPEIYSYVNDSDDEIPELPIRLIRNKIKKDDDISSSPAASATLSLNRLICNADELTSDNNPTSIGNSDNTTNRSAYNPEPDTTVNRNDIRNDDSGDCSSSDRSEDVGQHSVDNTRIIYGSNNLINEENDEINPKDLLANGSQQHSPLIFHRLNSMRFGKTLDCRHIIPLIDSCGLPSLRHLQIGRISIWYRYSAPQFGLGRCPTIVLAPHLILSSPENVIHNVTDRQNVDNNYDNNDNNTDNNNNNSNDDNDNNNNSNENNNINYDNNTHNNNNNSNDNNNNYDSNNDGNSDNNSNNNNNDNNNNDNNNNNRDNQTNENEVNETRRLQANANTPTFVNNPHIPAIYNGSLDEDLFFEGLGIYGSYHYMYEGNFHEGLNHGFGRMISRNGERYEGDWFRGRRHGRGKVVQVDGRQLEGDWWFDSFQGCGIMRSADNSFCFEGEWLQHTWHGWGVMTLHNRLIAFGQFHFGSLNGWSRLICPDGQTWVDINFHMGQPGLPPLGTTTTNRLDFILSTPLLKRLSDSATDTAATDGATVITAATDKATLITAATDSATVISAATDKANVITAATDSATDSATDITAATDNATVIGVATDSATDITAATVITAATDSATVLAAATDITAATDSATVIAAATDITAATDSASVIATKAATDIRTVADTRYLSADANYNGIRRSTGENVFRCTTGQCHTYDVDNRECREWNDEIRLLDTTAYDCTKLPNSCHHVESTATNYSHDGYNSSCSSSYLDGSIHEHTNHEHEHYECANPVSPSASSTASSPVSPYYSSAILHSRLHHATNTDSSCYLETLIKNSTTEYLKYQTSPSKWHNVNEAAVDPNTWPQYITPPEWILAIALKACRYT